MKFPLHVLVTASALCGASAWSIASGSSSSFTGHRHSLAMRSPTSQHTANLLMYESSRDPPNNSNNNQDSNVFSVLANTERWISETLSSKGSYGANPYSRKEVSYVCESQEEGAMIVAGIFRRLKEAREQGDAHGQAEEDRREEVEEDKYSPRTLRQTQVIVVPANKEFTESFHKFDGLVEAINEARRNARDLITDVSLEKLDDRMYRDDEDEEDRDWIVSVNCAHLHPKFGEKTPEQVLKEMKEEDQEGEVDLNLKAYQQKRVEARRSPYPTVVIEVRATPAPDFGPAPATTSGKNAPKEEITSQDVQKLEALFGRAAAMNHPTKEKSTKEEEEDFYDAIGAAFGIEEISTVTPMILAQNWIAENDPAFDVLTSTFTTTDTKHADEGYEFAFLNLAMQISRFDELGGYKKGMRQYLVMPSFLTSSATSMDKFATEMSKISSHVKLPGKLTVLTLHPEHVDTTKRAPVPILVFSWE